MTWVQMKRHVDEFLVGTRDIRQGTPLPDIYNRLAEWLLERGVRVRNPENVRRVFDYLDANKDVLWDERRRGSFVPMIEAEKAYERKNGITV